jgi:hypothetical protein
MPVTRGEREGHRAVAFLFCSCQLLD